MVSEACCNIDRTQAVFPDPVIPAVMEVKGCSRQNRWHFCENIATASKGVRPALRCLDITCLCILSFLLKNFSQTEQNQLMSTPQEQNVDWERGRMLRIYIGFQATRFYCFPPPRPPLPPPPHFYCFLSSTTTTTTATTFLLFSLHHHHHHHHISVVFSSTTTTTTTFLLFFLYHHHRHHISIVFLHHQNHLISSVFPPQDSIRD